MGSRPQMDVGLARGADYSTVEKLGKLWPKGQMCRSAWFVTPTSYKYLVCYFTFKKFIGITLVNKIICFNYTVL